jgi:CheY-like chemotaxis protein
MQQKVLITESNGDMKSLYNTILRDEYDLEFVEDGAAVISKMQAPPDIYLLNSRLPDMSVLQLCDYLHLQPATRDKPILILSASEDIKLFSEECPAEGYIRKPFRPAELLNMIHKLLVPDVNH